MTGKKRIVIIGGVAGGASCATRLRRHNEDFEIVLLERGPHVSFANCGLPYYISGVIEDEESLFLASPELFRDRFRIDAWTGSEVTKIDRANKTVQVESSGKTGTIQYDNLVLAPGAKPIRPNLPGIDLDGIFTLRNVPDSNTIRNWIKERNVRRAVVVGGGFIGLEMVENLVHLGIHTTLIERDTQIMPVLDAEMTVPLKGALQNQGVGLYLGESVSGFTKDGDTLQVQTDSGKNINCELVILAIGVTPENDLAEAAGLELGPRGHVIVDKCLRSSDPDIYAIGDCIEVRNVISGRKTALPLAGPANRQGRIVADMIAGRGRFFRGVQGTAVCGMFGHTVASTGLNEKAARQIEDLDYGAVYAHPSNHVGYYPGAKPIFIKLLFDKADGRVLGAQAVGEAGVERRIDVIAMAIQMKATVFDLEESELCYAPQYGAAKDPVNVIGMIAANEMRGDLQITHWDDMGRDDSVVLDVRNAHEIEQRNIPGAIHIPLNDIRKRHGELPESKDIHVTCAVGARAYNAVRLLHNLGHRASLLSGGEKTFAHLTDESDESAATSREQMDYLLSWEVMREEIARDDKELEKHLSLLQNPRVFVNLPLENVAEAFRRMETVKAAKGEEIIKQGDDGDSFYILANGQAEVWQQGLYDSEQKCVATLGKGGHFGDEALVTGGKRNATIRIVDDSELLRLGADDFRELISAPTLIEIDQDDTVKRMGEGSKILDVRYEEEFDEEHIPDAILIPLPELRSRLGELDHDADYVAVCHSGKRSAVASMILRQNEFSAVSMAKGMREWQGDTISEY